MMLNPILSIAKAPRMLNMEMLRILAMFLFLVFYTVFGVWVI